MRKTIAILFWILSACQVNHQHHQEGTLSKANQALHDEVMKIHDEVMPKHHIIAKYRDTLDMELKNEAIQKDTAKFRKYQQIRQELNYAYQAMNMWMREFGDLSFENKTEEEIKSILEKEKEKISKISEKMLGSLEAAKKRN